MNVPKRTWPSWLENKFFSSVKKLRPIARKMVTHINFGRYQINGRLVPTIDVLPIGTPKAGYASGCDQGTDR